MLEWGYCTAKAGSELNYLRGDALPPSPWPKPRDEQSWSGVLYSKRGVEQLSPWGCIRGPWDSGGRKSKAVCHHTGK